MLVFLLIILLIIIDYFIIDVFVDLPIQSLCKTTGLFWQKKFSWKYLPFNSSSSIFKILKWQFPGP